MSKKAFNQIKAGLDEALIIAPYIAQIEQLTAELAAERERREEAEDNERGHSAEAKYWREKVAKLREALERAREALIRISEKDTNADIVNGLEEGPCARIADKAIGAIADVLRETGVLDE